MPAGTCWWVKTSADDFSSAGAQIEAGGQITNSVASAPSLRLNRGGGDGDIIELNKAGAPVGSIGVGNSNDLTIGTADTGLVFQDNERISPWNPSTNSLRDDAIDFGDIDRRFKDLYLSGTVALTTADKASAANMFVSPSTDFLYLEHPANGMIFRNTSGAEAMRIDSSGNLLVGKTSGSNHVIQKSAASTIALNINNSSATSPRGASFTFSAGVS